MTRGLAGWCQGAPATRVGVGGFGPPGGSSGGRSRCQPQMPFEEVPKVRQAGELTQRGFCPIVCGWPMPRLPWPAPALPSLRSAQREVDGLGTVNAHGGSLGFI